MSESSYRGALARHIGQAWGTEEGVFFFPGKMNLRRMSWNDKDSRRLIKSNVSTCLHKLVLTGITCLVWEIGHFNVKVGVLFGWGCTNKTDESKFMAIR